MEWHSRFAVVGAEVAVIYSFDRTSIQRIVAVTEYAVVLDNDIRFNRVSGIDCDARSCDGWETHIVPVTQALRDQAEKEILVIRLSGVIWNNLSLDVLRKINGCLG
jgi:hypothetical protein